MRRYPNYDAAQRRIDKIKDQGVWPAGIGPDADGWYRLSFDPEAGAPE